MKRRTLKHLRPKPQPEQHHNVCIVLLDPAMGKLRKVRTENPMRDPKKPCVYVGMTGLTPEERFANHKAGIKNASLVKRYGIRLLPELYVHLNLMPFEAAAQMEKDLAEDLRRAAGSPPTFRYSLAALAALSTLNLFTCRDMLDATEKPSMKYLLDILPMKLTACALASQHRESRLRSRNP